jgi:hypothetical protein
MRHTDDYPNDSTKSESEYVYTRAGTCITERWKKAGWIPPSQDPAIQAKWAYYQSLPSRCITDSVEHV